ncbi:response regulator transcription factor [Roseovarius sp. Pro17]|uniref:response regulator n=1 Tax=Roseovarius sp. Pro17 TaxID=3108175 RepID=UPI002D77788A|nr:response regulator transcription factor [Roseovarius sp. Pro17]
MIVGYVLIGALAGLLAFLVAILLGASFWLAFGLYALVGSAVVILLPAVRSVAGVFVRHNEVPTVKDGWSDTRNPCLAKPSVSNQDSAIETSMTILAVDDDPLILELIPMISAKAGFSQVITAASGEQALKLLANSSMIFDCLLLDISMPGMNGVELCRRIRQIPHYRQTPIIMLTAKRDATNMGDAYRAGVTDYTTKPFDVDELGVRLRLAQEAVHTQGETGEARVESTRHHWSPTRNRRFELPDGLPLECISSLVDHAAFSNYLTKLSHKEVADIQVLAVSIDGIEALQMRSSPQQFASLLQDFAAVAADCFDVDQTIMTYLNNATLLIATNCTAPLSPINIEIDIARRLLRSLSAHGLDENTVIDVSLGGPVQLHCTKANRARILMDRAIALAENRSLDKNGEQVAGSSTG